MRNTRLAWPAVAVALALASVAAQDKPKPAPAAAPTGLEVLWRSEPVPVPGAATLAVGQSSIFLASSEAGLGAYTSVDGKPLWSSTLVSSIAPVTLGTQVAVISGDALHLLSQETGVEAWRAEVDKSTSGLFAFEEQVGTVAGAELRTWKRDGTAGWRLTLPAPASTRVVSRRGTLFVGLSEPSVVALDSATGGVRWRIALKTAPNQLAATDDLLHLAASDAMLYAVRTNGSPKAAWKFQLIGGIGEPVSDDRHVYFALLDNTITAFERKGGTKRWSTVMPSRPAAGPIRIGANLAIALATGAIVELGARDGKVVPPSAPITPTGDRLQAVGASLDGTRVFTLAVAGADSRRLIAWGHPPAKR